MLLLNFIDYIIFFSNYILIKFSRKAEHSGRVLIKLRININIQSDLAADMNAV